MKILLIGNSYTYYNDMPTVYFQELVKELDPDATVDAVTCGGWTLEKFADSKIPLGKEIDEMLEKNAYDVVVLQEQSVRPASEHGYAAFFDGARRLAKKIQSTSAKLVFYATWSHETGSQTLADYGWTHEEMTWRLAASYHAIAEELGGAVANVGFAFREIVRSAPEIDLYAHDRRSHPSPTGSYLAALTLVGKILESDPRCFVFRGVEDEAQDQKLKKAAAGALLQAPEIPPLYRISSRGISST